MRINFWVFKIFIRILLKWWIYFSFNFRIILCNSNTILPLRLIVLLWLWYLYAIAPDEDVLICGNISDLLSLFRENNIYDFLAKTFEVLLLQFLFYFWDAMFISWESLLPLIIEIKNCQLKINFVTSTSCLVDIQECKEGIIYHIKINFFYPLLKKINENVIISIKYLIKGIIFIIFWSLSWISFLFKWIKILAAHCYCYYNHLIQFSILVL